MMIYRVWYEDDDDDVCVVLHIFYFCTFCGTVIFFSSHIRPWRSFIHLLSLQYLFTVPILPSWVYFQKLNECIYYYQHFNILLKKMRNNKHIRFAPLKGRRRWNKEVLRIYWTLLLLLSLLVFLCFQYAFSCLHIYIHWSAFQVGWERKGNKKKEQTKNVKTIWVREQ